MQILLQEHLRFIKALAAAKVEFIIIGGYAVIYHGYPRTTDDLDVWLNPTEENKEKFISLLRGEGIAEEDLKKLNNLKFSEAQLFYVGHPPQRIDFLTSVKGLNFEDSKKNQVYLHIDHYGIPVLNKDHLIISKLLSDRPKDRADVVELQKITSFKNEVDPDDIKS